MYVDSHDKKVYSLNIFYNSEFRENLSNNNFYGLGLSSVLNKNNELSFSYSNQNKIKSFESYYKYYIKQQDLPIKFNLAVFYELKKNANNKKYNIYKSGAGAYLDFNRKNKTDLKFYPFVNYYYIKNDTDNIDYDILEAGLSIQFNDIGIEPSYKFIANGAYDIFIKIYLWEFSDY